MALCIKKVLLFRNRVCKKSATFVNKACVPLFLIHWVLQVVTVYGLHRSHSCCSVAVVAIVALLCSFPFSSSLLWPPCLPLLFFSQFICSFFVLCPHTRGPQNGLAWNTDRSFQPCLSLSLCLALHTYGYACKTMRHPVIIAISLSDIFAIWAMLQRPFAQRRANQPTHADPHSLLA